MNRGSYKSLSRRDRYPTLDNLLEVLKERRAIETLMQVQARIRELNVLIDLIENSPNVFNQLLDQLESAKRTR